MIATLRQRNFSRLWLGRLFSVTGDWALNIGLPIYIHIYLQGLRAIAALSWPSARSGPTTPTPIRQERVQTRVEGKRVVLTLPRGARMLTACAQEYR